MNIADSQTSLYDRIGGSEGIKNMVATFYSKVVADPALRPFFDHVAVKNCGVCRSSSFRRRSADRSAIPDGR